MDLILLTWVFCHVAICKKHSDLSSCIIIQPLRFSHSYNLPFLVTEALNQLSVKIIQHKSTG